MTAIIPVDAEIAESKVSPEFELILTPEGAAILVFSAKICTWDIDGRLAETKEAHAGLLVDGPFQVIPVPGAPVTLPSRYVYYLFIDGETPAWLGGISERYGGTEGVGAQQIEVQPFAPLRTGSVVENGTGGQGYRWTAYSTPVAPVLFGQTNFLYYERNPARPWNLVGQAAQLHNQVGEGVIVLETDPNSRLGDFGPVLFGLTVDAPTKIQGTLHTE